MAANPATKFSPTHPNRGSIYFVSESSSIVICAVQGWGIIFENLSNANLIGIEAVGMSLDKDGNTTDDWTKVVGREWVTEKQAKSEGGQTVYDAIQIYINRQHDLPRVVVPTPAPTPIPSPNPIPHLPIAPTITNATTSD